MRGWKGIVAVLAIGCGTTRTPELIQAASVTAEGTSEKSDLSEDHVVASWEGGKLSFADLKKKVEIDLRTAEIEYRMSQYELQSRALDQAVAEALLEAEAKRLQHPTVDALVAAEVEAKVKPVTDEEVKAFYPTVASRLGGASLEEATPFLRQELTRRAQQSAFAEYLDGLKAKSGVKLDFPYPDLPRIQVAVDATDPTTGAANAKVTIVQFAEYQCPFCGQAAETMDKVLQAYPNDVKLVWKDYTLPGHERAIPAAIAAHCAGEQGKYWEMNKVLLGHQDALEDADLLRYAKEIGLSEDKFKTCQGSGQYDAVIAANSEVGRKSGVSGTPAFFVNGILLSGAMPFDRFKTIIDRELAK